MSNFSVLVVGSGRLANHLCHYLKFKGQSFETWNRSSSKTLEAASQRSDLVLLAVNDTALELLAKELPGKQKIHFSGSVYIPGVLGLHPLMTFSKSLYDESFYDKIPLVLDQPDLCPPWIEQLPNQKMNLRPDDKILYHSLCHLAGNYPKFLWVEIARIFKSQLNLPQEILKPFLKEVLNQSFSEKPDSLTGPFARGDLSTIEGHLAALNHTPLKKSYEGFLAAYKEAQV